VLAWLESLDPVYQAGLGGLFTWAVTALGATVCLFTRTVNRALLTAMLGFAAGVMIAASFWSLLVPALEIAEARGGLPGWVPAALGIVMGGVFLRIADRFVPHLHPGKSIEDSEGPRTELRRSTLLVLAITLHNIPEGLAVGVVFGGAASALVEGATQFNAAIALTLGIGLQNFPEGVAVAMPLRAGGVSRGRSFWYGQLSGVVEPISAIIGAAAVLMIEPILPYALAFAAGAMLYVVIEELIPGSQQEGYTDLATMSALGGFIVMMILDVALG
jgi:zinc transporter, ZIP family